MRCVNCCPEAAIEFGRFTKGKKRDTYWQGDKWAKASSLPVVPQKGGCSLSGFWGHFIP